MAASDALSEICIHHWVLEPPVRSISRGLCKRCGEQREFSNGESRFSFPPPQPRKKGASEATSTKLEAHSR